VTVVPPLSLSLSDRDSNSSNSNSNSWKSSRGRERAIVDHPNHLNWEFKQSLLVNFLALLPLPLSPAPTPAPVILEREPRLLWSSWERSTRRRTAGMLREKHSRRERDLGIAWRRLSIEAGETQKTEEKQKRRVPQTGFMISSSSNSSRDREEDRDSS
jgi:hypothetical protein